MSFPAPTAIRGWPAAGTTVMTERASMEPRIDPHRFDDGARPQRGSKVEKNERLFCCQCGGVFFGPGWTVTVQLFQAHEAECYLRWRARLAASCGVTSNAVVHRRGAAA